MALTASTIFRLVNEMHDVLDPEPTESEIDEQEIYAMLSSFDSVDDQSPQISKASPNLKASSSLRQSDAGPSPSVPQFPSIMGHDSRPTISDRKRKRKATESDLHIVSRESPQLAHSSNAKRRRISNEPITMPVAEPARKPPHNKFADPRAQRLAEDYRQTCRNGTYHRHALRRTSTPRVLRASSAPPELGISIPMTLPASTGGATESTESIQKVTEPDSPQLEVEDLFEIYMGADLWHSSVSEEGDYLANGRRRRRELERAKRNDSNAPPPTIPPPASLISISLPAPRPNVSGFNNSWPWHKSHPIMKVVYEKGDSQPPISRGPPPRPHFPVFAREGILRGRPRVAVPS